MLSIDNLHAGCEGKTILQGINLDVKPGEVHAIMGPNGSGKSTLSTVVAGHEDYEVSQGTILFEGEDIADLSACLLYTSPSPRDRTRSRMPSSA